METLETVLPDEQDATPLLEDFGLVDDEAKSSKRGVASCSSGRTVSKVSISH